MMYLCLFFVLLNWSVGSVHGQQNTSSQQPLKNLSANYNVAICIVGQAQRLETQTKLRNLVIPTSANPLVRQLYVVGILDSTGSHYSNGATTKLDHCYSSNYNIQTLFHNTFGSSPHVFVDSVFSPSQENVTLSNRVHNLFRYYRIDRANDYHFNEDRFSNHMRQFGHDRACLERLQMIEHEQNVSIDVVARIRDNGLIVRPFDIISLMQRYA
ncbi:hypothetical protein EON65_54300, partial [archaeon]